MGSVFAQDTTVRQVADGRWQATITPRWNVGDAPNGGYTMAVALRALREDLPHPDPLTASGHYLRRAEPGPAVLTTEVVKTGRTTSTGEVRLHQDGSERLRVLASFADLSTPGPTRIVGGPPQLPPPDACVAGEGVIPGGIHAEVERRFDLRVPPGTYGWATGRPKGVAAHSAWIRFADGSDVDLLGLCVVCDTFPPSVFDLGAVGWIPTIELTVHLRAHPAPGWLRARVGSRYLTGGFVEEDVEVWDADDRLVALSRQMAYAARVEGGAPRGRSGSGAARGGSPTEASADRPRIRGESMDESAAQPGEAPAPRHPAPPTQAADGDEGP